MSEQALRIENHAALDDARVGYWRNETLGEWFIYLPGCGAGRLSQHQVVEHEDGTISVTPSILMRGHNNGTPSERHGYLTRGIWNEI